LGLPSQIPETGRGKEISSAKVAQNKKIGSDIYIEEEGVIGTIFLKGEAFNLLSERGGVVLLVLQAKDSPRTSCFGSIILREACADRGKPVQPN